MNFGFKKWIIWKVGCLNLGAQGSPRRVPKRIDERWNSFSWAPCRTHRWKLDHFFGSNAPSASSFFWAKPGLFDQNQKVFRFWTIWSKIQLFRRPFFETKALLGGLERGPAGGDQRKDPWLKIQRRTKWFGSLANQKPKPTKMFDLIHVRFFQSVTLNVCRFLGKQIHGRLQLAAGIIP